MTDPIVLQGQNDLRVIREVESKLRAIWDRLAREETPTDKPVFRAVVRIPRRPLRTDDR